MKLRIKGNTLRIRVARSELAWLAAGGQLTDETRFAAAPDACFKYALQVDAQIDAQTEAVIVKYEHKTAVVSLSREAVAAWQSEDEIGIYARLHISESTELEVSVEKDFACLDRSDEDNSDTFANPAAEKAC